MGIFKKKDKKAIVIKALASVHEAYDQTPRGTFNVGELERIAEQLLKDLKQMPKGIRRAKCIETGKKPVHPRKYKRRKK